MRNALEDIVQSDMNRMMLAFRDSKETQEYNTITMCPSDVVVYIANR